MDFLRRIFAKADDKTLLRESATVDRGGIYDGTVGWEDGSDHFDLDSDSGVTLVKVTLFKGHNPTTDGEKTTARARGTRVLCRIGAPLFNVPPDGAQVVVAMPAERMLVPGGGVIISQVIASPGNQFSATKAKMDFGPDFDLVIKARSVTFTDYEDRYISVGPKFGIKMGDATGNGAQLKNDQWLLYTIDGDNAATTLRLSKTDGIALMIHDGKTCGFTMKDGEWVGVGTLFKALFAGGYLGSAPSAATPMTYGASTASLGSTAWFISPT